MRRKNATLNSVGGFVVTGLIAAYFMRKIEKENEETDRMIRESRERMLKHYEEFNSELIAYQEETQEALEPFGEYLDELKKLFDEETEH